MYCRFSTLWTLPGPQPGNAAEEKPKELLQCQLLRKEISFFPSSQQCAVYLLQLFVLEGQRQKGRHL